MADTIKNVYTYTTINNSGVNLDVTNIPQDAKHLLCYMTADASSGSPTITYNNLASNYAWNYRVADSNTNQTSTSGSNLSGLVQWAWSNPTHHGALFIIPFYSNNGDRKAIISHNGMNYYWTFNGTWYYYPYAGTYVNLNNTSPVSSIQFNNLPGNFSLSIDLVY